MEKINYKPEIIIEMLESIEQKALNEELNIFEVGKIIKKISDKVKFIKENISEIEKKEFSNYLPEELKEMGISISGGGYTYKFDHIKEWAEKKKELKAIEDKAKKAFNINNKTVIEIDKETGEVVNDDIEIEPAIATPRKQSVSYKIK